MCGRPGGDSCFLKVGGNDVNSTPINQNALQVLTENSNKHNRRLGKQFLSQKKDGEHSSPNTEDEVKIVSDTSSVRASPTRAENKNIFFHRHVKDWMKNSVTSEISSKYKPLLQGYQYELDILYLSQKAHPDDVSIENKINEVRAKQLRLIQLQNSEMEEKFGL